MRWAPLSVRSRALWLALFPATLACVMLSGLFVWTHWEEAFDRLRDRGQMVTRQLASASEYGVFAGNVPVLQALAESVLAESDVDAVAIFGANGELLVKVGAVTTASPATLWALRDESHHDLGRTLVFARPVELAPLADESLLGSPGAERLAPVGGYVLVEVAKREAYGDQRRLLLAGSGIVGMVLLLALSLALWISRGITRPLQRVVDAVTRVGDGALDVHLPERGGPDLSRLSSNINRMVERLSHARADMQREIDAATSELRRRKEDAEQSNVAKTRFLAAASHDLRQPMHALGLFSAQLRAVPLSDEAAHLAERIGQSVEVMSALLDALLDISRLDAGATAPRRAPLSAASLFARLALGFTAEADNKGLQFRVRPASSWIYSDPALLEQLLRNLLANALRYTTRGRILLAARRRGDRLRIEVRDSGPGIAPEMQSLIFQEFVQLDNPERDREKGLGLGLAIVQRLGQLLDHPFGVHSRPGRGAVFWVEVPLTEAVLQAPAPVSGRRSLLGAVVLLVDDDAAVRDSTAGLLESWGCVVVGAASTAELLALPALRKVSPDVLICDHRRRGPNDEFVAVEVCRGRFGATLPALLLSGETNPALAHAASQHGLPLLYKPVRPARLRAALNALLPASPEAEAETPGSASPL